MIGLLVKCPNCGAVPGQSCVGCRDRKRDPHVVRTKLARKERREAIRCAMEGKQVDAK